MPTTCHRIAVSIVSLLIAGGCHSNSESSRKMSDISTFEFDGHGYQIVRAEIVAVIGDPYWCDTYNGGKGKSISWGIRFETESDDDELSPPSVDFDGIWPDIKDWHDLVGYQTSWTSAINPRTDERYGMTYVYDHQLITNGSVKITARDGTAFQIVASGENEEGQ